MTAASWRQTYRVGSRHVLAVSDGVFTMDEGFMNVPGIPRALGDGGDVAELPIASFVVPGEQNLLIDAGLGRRRLASLSGGALLDELAAVGFRPEDVDVLAVSHLHLDHDGWITNREGQRVFPNATVYIGRRDYEHFVLDDSQVESDFKMWKVLRSVLAGMCDDGDVVLVDDTSEIVPGVVALPTPGHTPGHLAFAIRDDGEQLFVVGDSMYCPAQLTDIDLAAMHDVDPVLARRSRELIQRELEAHGTSAVGCHFPGLHAARLVGSDIVAID